MSCRQQARPLVLMAIRPEPLGWTCPASDLSFFKKKKKKGKQCVIVYQAILTPSPATFSDIFPEEIGAVDLSTVKSYF